MAFDGKSHFIIEGVIVVKSCTWSIVDVSSDFNHFDLSGGIFRCNEMLINPFTGNGVKLFVCEEGGIFDCYNLQAIGTYSPGNAVIDLNTGTSLFRDSIFKNDTVHSLGVVFKNSGNSNLTLIDCSFIGGSEGIIHLYNANITIISCLFKDCSSGMKGGGIVIVVFVCLYIILLLKGPAGSRVLGWV
jgi:hypothetical protein